MGVTDHIHWVIGDGCMTNFFYDVWLSDLSLSRWLTFISWRPESPYEFLTLFSLSGVVGDLTE